MYNQAYGIIETLAPLHVGASSGEEAGNLNLIFRDQFSQTGIIPGSSLRGRFRADMRYKKGDINYWYGREAIASEKTGNNSQDLTTEGMIKFEYASLVWIPVYCPNQPIVWVSCPMLLKRYQKIVGLAGHEIKPYTYSGETSSPTLFFNLGFIRLKTKDEALKNYLPKGVKLSEKDLVLVVDDKDMSMIHDMALYRQSRVALEPDKKKAKKGAFFDVEALPEGSILAFPIAFRKEYEGKAVEWQEFLTNAKFTDKGKELYFGGLESIGFGRTQVFLNLYPV
ncbi:conserved hypothetical protein [Planktothrix sp. PCC 11201]|uniref:type III-B CRISPR module RAMP protein Cmr4 n=1 Tax=Planktothrix sp. PCC 11201 TaxID=1729650 RepID=UPI0009163219|nr:type III-B CRISPR module RAMP protein Cmr4 [Planktothrix sp. PCC 11201]SKB13811.1 conserved hypothetical protein [Planktothrix sp. PCC 11201]